MPNTAVSSRNALRRHANHHHMDTHTIENWEAGCGDGDADYGDSRPQDDAVQSVRSVPSQDRTIGFAEVGVPEPLVHALALEGKHEPFAIQRQAIPDALAGCDVLGRGRTGSGKTLAFCIPLVARLGDECLGRGATMAAQAETSLPSPRGLILAPTRELANQINDVLTPLAMVYGLRSVTIYGGVKQRQQERALHRGADIIVACPGRLEDLLSQKLLSLSQVRVAVLDEADEMADMGFLPAVTRLLEAVHDDAQCLLFSATLDHGVNDVVERFMHEPREHSVDSAAQSVDAMTHLVWQTTRGDKNELIRTLAGGVDRSILFTRTKYQAEKLAKHLTRNGMPAAQLHGNLSQRQRDNNLRAFETGQVRILVATDVAARGIDVPEVRLVVQVDPPDDIKALVHRSGRTARAGQTGTVVTVVLPEQRRYTQRLMRQAGLRVEVQSVSHDDEQVRALAGERAPIVHDWTLDTGDVDGERERGGRRRRGRRDDAAQERRRSRGNRSRHEDSHNGERDARRGALRDDAEVWRDAAQRARRDDASREQISDTVKEAVNRPTRGSGRIHRKPIEVISDERGESVKRHERRMQARRERTQRHDYRARRHDRASQPKKESRSATHKRADHIDRGVSIKRDTRRDSSTKRQSSRHDEQRRQVSMKRSRKTGHGKRTPFRMAPSSTSRHASGKRR